MKSPWKPGIRDVRVVVQDGLAGGERGGREEREVECDGGGVGTGFALARMARARRVKERIMEVV